MTEEPIYLDSAATTRPFPDVSKAMLPYLENRFANPSSLHEPARDVRAELEDARKDIAEVLDSQSREIIFTSGGTEANNLAIRGLARANRDRGNHIVCTEIEHKSILRAVRDLEEQSFNATRIPPNEQGRVTAEAVEDAIQENTALVSVMLANNETGTIQPIRDIARITQDRGILLHTDAVQGAGKIPGVSLRELAVDALTISAHKIHGPKGAGLLCVRDGIKVQPDIVGGDHEMGRRAGTENVPAIMGFRTALIKSSDRIEETRSHLETLRNQLFEGLRETIPDIQVNSPDGNVLPSILNVSFPKVEGETMVIMLDRNGVCASTGAACESDRVETSHVLRAMNFSRERTRSAVRFSLSGMNTSEEIERALDVIPSVYRDARNL